MLVLSVATPNVAHFAAMPKFEFCLPTLGMSLPARPEWFHEIKYDGYRVYLERRGRVRLITKGGYDWMRRYPRFVEAALKNGQKRFVIDGVAIVRGIDDYSDFNALYSGKSMTSRAARLRHTRARR